MQTTHMILSPYQQNKLRELAEIKDPNLKIQRILADRTIVEALLVLEKLQGVKGDTGEQGPQGDKGEQGEAGSSGGKGEIGERGVRGPQGSEGKKGERGERGERGLQGPVGVSPSTESIVAELRKNPVKYDDIEGAPSLKTLAELITFLKMGGFRGGGSSTTSGSVTYSYDLSSQCNGVNKIFTIPAFTRIILLTGTDAPIIYKPTTDYVASGITLTLDALVNAPSTGATFILTYTP